MLASTMVCNAGTTNDFKPLGDLVVLQHLPSGQSVSNITLTAGLNAKQGGGLDPTGFRKILECASPASPDLAKSWQFADWYHGTFVLDGRTNSFALYLGGLGLLSQPDGTRGLFRFKKPEQPQTMAGGTNTFLAYYRSFRPVKVLEPGRSTCLTNGITFKQIVDALGPGWRSPSEGIGLVSWTFNDGREVWVRLPHYGPHAATMTPAQFFWITNRGTQTITNGDPTPQPRYLKL
jgi:hypothetical protein